MQYDKSITATVYIVKNNKVLLHMHKKYKTWFPVGGHLNPGELPHEAAIREVCEETGLTIKLIDTDIIKPFELGRVERIPSPFIMCHEGIGHSEEFWDLIYIAETTDTVLNPAKGESSEFRWFSL